MKKILLSSVAFVALGGAAFAADLPVRTMAPAPSAAYAAVPMFTWTGFYAGLHAGYGWTDGSATAGAEGGASIGAVAGGVVPGRGTFDGDGAMFGAQVGYNAQFGAVVAGIEGDLSWTDFGGRSTFTSAAGDVTVLRSDLDWLSTVRARLGFAFDRTLLYATGGFAFGNTNHRGDITLAAGPTAAGSSDEVATGYSIGAGIEYAFTNNMTLKAEWLYYDLGRETVRVAGTGGGAVAADFVDYRFDNDGHIGRVGVNFKF